jgi:hypothetical protein
MKYDWNKILQPSTVVHLPKEWMQDMVSKEADKKGLK